MAGGESELARGCCRPEPPEQGACAGGVGVPPPPRGLGLGETWGVSVAGLPSPVSHFLQRGLHTLGWAGVQRPGLPGKFNFLRGDLDAKPNRQTSNLFSTRLEGALLPQRGRAEVLLALPRGLPQLRALHPRPHGWPPGPHSLTRAASHGLRPTGLQIEADSQIPLAVRPLPLPLTSLTFAFCPASPRRARGCPLHPHPVQLHLQGPLPDSPDPCVHPSSEPRLRSSCLVASVSTAGTGCPHLCPLLPPQGPAEAHGSTWKPRPPSQAGNGRCSELAQGPVVSRLAHSTVDLDAAVALLSVRPGCGLTPTSWQPWAASLEVSVLSL